MADEDSVSGSVSLTSQSGDQDLNAGENGKRAEKQKIDILLKPTGNAPIMKKKKWSVDAEKPIGWIIDFIKKYLKLEADDKLFLYVNQSFAPAPDQIIRNLYDCYNAEGKLVLHYARTPAWG